jgi:hypothetical protein
MPKLKLSDLPENLRIKLTQSGRRELWHRVNEFGGAKNLAEEFDYSQSKIYNWKNKNLALPVNFVRRIMGDNNTGEIVLLKGPGSSGKVEDPDFPLEVTDELLTRIQASVTENTEGTPIYITSEKPLQERFAHLLNKLGNVEFKTYIRESRYEVRYPKFLQTVFSGIEFEEDLVALIDETAKIRDQEIILADRRIPVNSFDTEIFSREKSFEIALERGDSETIAELIAEESEKVKHLTSN